MGVRCRIHGVPDKEDNVYLNPAVAKQVINDISEKARDEKRKMTCGFCKTSFVRTGNNPEFCPKCRHEQPEEGDED